MPVIQRLFQWGNWGCLEGRSGSRREREWLEWAGRSEIRAGSMERHQGQRRGSEWCRGNRVNAVTRSEDDGVPGEDLSMLWQWHRRDETAGVSLDTEEMRGCCQGNVLCKVVKAGMGLWTRRLGSDSREQRWSSLVQPSLKHQSSESRHLIRLLPPPRASPCPSSTLRSHPFPVLRQSPLDERVGTPNASVKLEVK
jgi:hypothetical protein